MPTAAFAARRIILVAGFTIGAVHGALAQDVTNPNDPLTPSSANSPGGEAVANVIDDSGATKYLNFDRANTGFTVTPSGSGIVTALVFVTANDAPERDPAGYLLEGSADGVNFSLITQGSLVLPTARFALATVSFPNTSAFVHYRLTFPDVRSPLTANSMQIGEVQLSTAADILTPGDGVTVTYAAGASSPAGQGGAAAFDNLLGTAFTVTNGNLGATTIDITPSVGRTTITGLNLFSGANAQNFPLRIPGSITILGTNNGVDFAQVFSTGLATPFLNFQDQQFTFANAVSFARYRVVLGASSDALLQIGDLQLIGTIALQTPANDECAGAQAVVAGTTSSSNFNATGTDTTPCGPSDSLDVWFSYAAGSSGMVEASTCGVGTLDTTLAVYSSCGGTVLGCDDNSCSDKSRVRWTAQAGQNYRIRVAGVAGSTGTFSLTINPSPVVHTDVSVPLAFNFNGIVHPGEAGNPDSPTGYRSISDRGLRITGQVGSIEVGLEGPSGIPYSIPSQADVVDMVYLGNRNQVDGGLRFFDAVADGDDIGIQPTWLPSPDLTGEQVTPVSTLNLTLNAQSRIGVLFNASNGGNTFAMNLGFTTGAPISVTLSAPDWFGTQDVLNPAAGVETQLPVGTFLGTALTDSGVSDVDLNVVEAVVSVADLITDGFGDVSGRTLQSISFSGAVFTTSGIGIYAATVRDAGAACPADFNGVGGLTVQDIFDFLNAYFAADIRADFNQSGSVTVQDIFDFLNAYFAGC